MKRPPSIADFQRLIRKLGKLVVTEVTEKLAGKRHQPGWASAFIEARWTSDSDAPWQLSRLRVVAPNCKRIKGIHTTDAMNRILDQIEDMKNNLLPDRWYGLKLTVFPDAKPQLELNHAPDCSVDPRWFRT